MERHTRLSRAAVVLVAIALIASIAAAVWFASPDAPYVPSEDSGAALGTAAPAEDGTVADQQTTVPSGYTGIYTTTNFGSVRSGGRGTNGSSAKYILMEDITVTSIDTTAWSGSDGNPWKGELDGNGHTITLSGTAEGEYYDNGGLFSVIGGGAYIHDLTVQVGNVRVNNNAGNANFGTIAGAASGNATIDNVYISLNKDSSSNNDTYLSSQGTSWLGGVLGKLDTSGTVEIKNTTVYNSAEGSNGFSATINKSNGVYVGGFVGSIDKGSLKMTNVVYKADANAKISAIAINSTGWFDGDNMTFVGGILGYHNEGSFELDGCIIDAAITLNSGFRTVNGDTAHAGYILGQVDSNLNDTWSSIYMNSSNGTTWLDGNNETRGTAVRYDKSVFADIRFADGEKVAVAVGKQSPANAGSIPRTITQGADTSKISDAEIAGAITEGSGTAWLTINKVNATTNVKMSVGDSVSTGNYNLTSPTISSVDGTTYKGSKEYDGTAYATPYITIGSKQINAWTADNTTADAGVKNFAYAGDSALTGYQVVSYANGDKYLVKDGTVYSPSTITIGGQSGQAFKLGNSFSYEITPASVTVTPSVPTDLYAGNPMPDITATAVDKNNIAVEGNIAWDDPDAPLLSGKNSYNWTWTPTSSNYQTVKDSMELEAFDRKIESLSVQGDFKKAYTAYEPFDSTNVEVIAHYSDGSSEQLVNDEYEFTVMNGDKNRLIVGNDTVTVSLKKGSGASTTIKITVSKLAVDVPIANQDLVYNGAEQIGVAASADNYYSLSGDTGTNARDYTATAELKDKVNTRWDTDTEDDTADKRIAWSIAKKKVAITVMHTSKTYDGQEVEPKTLFTAPNGVDGQPLDLDIVVADDKTILNAGTYSVTASLAESETNYTADSETITYTVDKKLVSGEIVADDLVYDGTEKGATFNGQLIGEDKVEIKYAGDRMNVTEAGFTATANLPSDNYAWADDAAPSATFTISPKDVEIESIQELTKTYDGEAVDPSSLFPAPNGVDGQPIELTVTVDGDKTILNAGTYTVSAKPTSANYAGACEVEYIIQKASPSVTVKVDTDTTYYSSQSLYDIAIGAEEPSVAGNIAWEEGQVLSAATTEYSWVFTPDDVDNYEIVTGTVTLKVENVTLNHIEVTKNPDKMSYVAYSDFDATGMIVTAYFDGADARELGIEELTLSGNKNLQYGNGKATITIEFQEKTATVTVDVTKMLIPVPKAQTGIVFDGELHTGIVKDEQWSQYYHVDAESEERYAGTYTAVVNLNDVNNTAWEGTEDSEPKEIPWTIDHVTIEVTVKAESKTVEYGTAYSWDPYGFFAVEVTNSDLFEVKLGVFNDGSITDISTANVGEYSEGIFASVTRKDGGALEEQDLASFKFSKDIKQLAMKVIVTAKTVEVALDENVDFAAYDGKKLSEEELFGMFKMEMNIEDLAFEVDGVPYDAAEIVNAGEYTVKVVSANGNYNLTGTTEGVYKIAKASLVDVTASAESDGLDTSDDLYAVPLNVKGVGVKGEEVSGTGVWASGQSLIEGTNNYKFVFTPDQEFAVNYEVCEGECEIANVAQATLTDVSVKIVATKEYVAFDAFDRSSIVVEALYGEDRKQVTGYTLAFSGGSTEDRLLAGTGITVTVTYTDGDVTQYTEFTIDVAKRTVAKPVVDTTVFDATGETITLPIAESDYYTVEDNTAIEPGRYVATVTLKDPANTMWADGSTDVVSIAWTISEPVTSDEVIADILAMEKVTWQNAEEFLDLEARYNALDESEQTAEATAKLATLKAQYDALRNAAFDDIEAAHEVTAKSLGRALAAAAAGLSAAAIALAIAKRRSI